MIDGPENVASGDASEMGGLIREDFAARFDDLLDDPGGLMLVHRECPAAPVAFTEDGHTLALAGAASDASAILTERTVVARADVAAEVCAIDLDFAAKRSRVLAGRDGFAELMLPHESGLVGHLKFLAHADGTEPLRRIDEMGSEQQQFTVGELPTGEDGARGC